MTVPSELANWRRIRRFAVPPSMIAAATAARLAGDWAGACAAARMESTVDLQQVARDFGRSAADGLAEDLAHFAPDLLRWHLPRHLGGRTGISPRVHAILTPGAGLDGPLLQVVTPSIVTGSQRLELRVVRRSDLADLRYYDAPRHTWDARRAGDLRHAWGGSDDRPPLLNPDGSPVPADRLGRADDRAADSERVLAQLAAGEAVEAFRLAGIELDTTEPQSSYVRASAVAVLGRSSVWPIGLAGEVRRLARLHGVDEVFHFPGWPARLRLRPMPDGRMLADFLETKWPGKGQPDLAEQVWRRPADLDLLARGLLRPDDLHPLVRASLFPRLPPPAAPPPTPAAVGPVPVRVRCRGAWHVLRLDGGRVQSEEHDRDEEERERTLRALGGTSAGCFAAQHAWRTGTGRLPKAMRRHRADLVERIFHGDTDFVVDLLDAGRLDPFLRDGRGWTLLHMLLYLDHEPLLPRLLAAGLPIDVRENTGRTPLHVAVGNDGSAALARALFEAGADPRAADEWDGGIQDLLDYQMRPGFEFLVVEDGQ